jgi:hypothetical protein
MSKFEIEKLSYLKKRRSQTPTLQKLSNDILPRQCVDDVFSNSTLMFRTKPKYYKDASFSVATLECCDAYVRSATLNGTATTISGNEVELGCLNTLLAQSGATFLNSIRIPVLSVETFTGPNETNILFPTRLARLKVLDAHAETSGRCSLTGDGDGRHYHPIDLRLLKLIADSLRGPDISNAESAAGTLT